MATNQPITQDDNVTVLPQDIGEDVDAPGLATSLFPDIVTLNSPCLILLLSHKAEGISNMVYI